MANKFHSMADEFKRRLAEQPIIRKEKYIVEGEAPVQQQPLKQLTREELQEIQYNNSQTLSKLNDVLRTLKQYPTAHDQQQLIRRLAFDPFDLPLLFTAMTSHPKLIYIDTSTSIGTGTAGKKTFEYKPTYPVKCREDVEKVVREASKSGFGGVDVSELLDSWKGVGEVLDEMEKDQCVFLVRGKGDVPKLCLWNDSRDMLKISDEFREKWHETVVPPEDELQGELERVGLKAMQVFGGKNAVKKVKQRKSNKRTKITNTHLTGIDLRAEMAKK